MAAFHKGRGFNSLTLKVLYSVTQVREQRERTLGIKVDSIGILVVLR